MSNLLVSLLLLAFAACGQEGATPRQRAEPTTAALPVGITRVADPSQVCMVNDQFMGRAQIPVEVDGRTYFGCCPMCKDRLNSQPEIRTARDPVSGQPVDKAKAVIVQDATGKVLYFASEDTLRRYRG